MFDKLIDWLGEEFHPVIVGAHHIDRKITTPLTNGLVLAKLLAAIIFVGGIGYLTFTRIFPPTLKNISIYVGVVSIYATLGYLTLSQYLIWLYESGYHGLIHFKITQDIHIMLIQMLFSPGCFVAETVLDAMYLFKAILMKVISR